jgi:pimeloyl-ACP methyl ester carboxylesterase
VKYLLGEGYRLCAVDLRGLGETSPDMAGKFWDFLAGKPIFGQRVSDVMATIKWLKESEIKAQNIKLWGTGMGALYGAFAGVLTDDISELVLEEPLISFESVVQVEVPKYRHEIILPGILEKFDMTQVYQALSPRPLAVLNPFLGDKTSSEKSDIEKIDKSVSATYKGRKRQNDWRMQKVSGEERGRIIRDVLKAN